MNTIKRQQIFERWQAQNPNPTTELVYNNAFELLIAVILSAQATDLSVNKATKTLFRNAPTPEAMLKLGETTLKQYIQTIGLYNSKARNIMKTCAALIELHDSEIPNQREQLESLPGVGRKTANVVLNTYFGIPTIAVDTHVFRVANRTGLAQGKTPKEIEEKLLKSTPKQFLPSAHHWLILHGRYICTARKPHCPTCLIKDLCEYRNKTVLPEPP